MIKIRLASTIFDPGGYFWAVYPRSRAVLSISTGKPEGYVGSRAIYPQTSLSYRGDQFTLLVDDSGTEVSDELFETYMKNDFLKASVGMQIIDFMERNLIDVLHDGTALTPAQAADFVAP